MFKKLFLSIIILSALASENGVYNTADLFDLYLVNLSHLDMMQESRNARSVSQSQKEDSLDKKGKPLSFFKEISEDAINRKVSNNNRHGELALLMSVSITILSSLVLVYFISTIYKAFFSKRALLSQSDSSPPVCC
ncbi:hypothetical protein [Ruminiclostridium cellulolyticum]|uniref:Uncharacterized protein n=1 Tax=Ruminiclostridium cellulolyticum (strain ATCC 35319 / DSM 5812 / JCM 6584 / H10) TaxID=394503 RepID=B8I1Y4_RUMCH|nr:hypothetical protein [Ruminiclostridium cellulolyticum]ACL75810.1 hypothetical protein Ccel_1456 [Ruminiclostridium cellulolyticum H10]